MRCESRCCGGTRNGEGRTGKCARRKYEVARDGSVFECGSDVDADCGCVGAGPRADAVDGDLQGRDRSFGVAAGFAGGGADIGERRGRGGGGGWFQNGGGGCGKQDGEGGGGGCLLFVCVGEGKEGYRW